MAFAAADLLGVRADGRGLQYDRVLFPDRKPSASLRSEANDRRERANASPRAFGNLRLPRGVHMGRRARIRPRSRRRLARGRGKTKRGMKTNIIDGGI